MTLPATFFCGVVLGRGFGVARRLLVVIFFVVIVVVILFLLIAAFLLLSHGHGRIAFTQLPRRRPRLKRCGPYLQALLEAGRLVLSVLGDGGVGTAAFTGPRLTRPAGVPVLVCRLLDLSPHLHRLLRVGLHQRLGGKQAQV